MIEILANLHVLFTREDKPSFISISDSSVSFAVGSACGRVFVRFSRENGWTESDDILEKAGWYTQE